MTTPQDPFATPPEGGASSAPPPSGPPPSAPPPSGPAWGAPAPGAPAQGGYGGGYGAPSAPPGYGGGGFGDPGRPQGTSNGFGVASLVLGLLGLFTSWLVFGGLLGIVAIVLGIIALGKVKRGEASSKGMPIAGIILGVISILVAILIAVVGASLFDDVSNLSDCLTEAEGDPAAEADCEREFEDSVTG